MTDSKALVAYASKGGVTAEYASAIAEVLRRESGLDVDVVNLLKEPAVNPAPYENIVVGTGVRMQRVYREVMTFLEQKVFGGKRVAVFVTSVEPRDTAIKKYVRRVLQRCPHLQLIATEAFGGRLQVVGRAAVDHRDVNKVRVWARALGTSLSR